MQSFRERSGGYHSNQPCYQQEPHELSRLETYRQHPHHPQPQHPHPSPGPHPGPVPGPGPGPGPGHTRTGYEALSLANPTSMPPTGGPGTGGGPKDCYSQQAYPGYPGNGGGNGSGNGGSAPSQAKKSYRPSKVPQTNTTQHLQGPGAYSNHMGPGSYSAQYISEGHLQQKWEDQAQLAQYDQELIGRMEGSGTPAPGSSQYMDQNMLGHSQTQCHQPSTPAYTSPHHQPHPPNPAQSPLMYPQSHLHYPQHSPSPSPYMEKCSPMPHCYKGYNMPTNSQYGRQMSSNINLKQGGYRPTQNSYSYQQPPSRAYEQQPPLQAMTNPQESHTKYQHYSQPQQNYCLSDLSVRSPEQYYQTCSPSSSHSPARSVGRSPSYSSTPSPLMTNPESFQYGQPPMTPGAASSSSSSSAGMQDQASTNTMLMPPRSHPSPNVPHAAPHSYTTTPQVPTMKERFSEKLLSNPSLWSLNALTSQVENISNNVQQLLLSEALVANKKGSKRSSGGSNSSVGSGASSKKGDEYKSPPYPDSGAGSVGPMQDPYSTPQHQPMPMELHEGGYSSSSDEQLERGYYYCGQGRSPAQAPNNTQQSLDTASSCSMTSPDDMSTRSGDSGLHNLTPDPTRCQSGQGGDGMSTPVKSIGDERSPTSITIPSPMKQERDSPLDIQHISEPVKENFEESAWTEKPVDKEEVTTDKNPDLDRDSDMTKSTENLEKWSDEEKCTARYSDLNKDETDKGYCYKETLYQHVQSKYDSDARDSVEQSPAALSDSSHKEHFVNEMKSEAFKSESPTASESSVKTLPFVSGGDLEQDQYSTEKDDSSENASPTPLAEVLNESNMDKRESRDEEDEEREDEEEAEEKNEEIQKQKLHTLSPPLSADEREELGEGETVSQSSTEDHMNNKNVPEKPLGDLCRRTENQSTELLIDNESAGAPSHPNPAAVTAAAGASERESAIGDTAPQPQSSLPVFSALNDKGTLQARDHIDHSDAKVLEPDSPQLPGKSILPSAPSWADTPPSPKKGDEDMEPGISCASAVTPLAKPEPVAPSAQPRAFGRKHARGRRRIMQSGDGIRRQLSLEREGEKEQEGAPSPTQKPCMSPSKTVLFTDQTDLAHQESIVSQTPKMLTDAFRSRMCTRSFNSLDSPPKVEPNVKRKPGPKPGPKPGSKPGPKPGPKPGAKPGPKPGPKPGLKPGPKPGLRPGPKPGPKPGQKPVPNEPELPLKIETTLRRKPGPKPGSKPGAKPGPKPGPKTGSKQAPKPGPKAGHKPGTKPAEILPPADTTPLKGSVGRPKGSVSKARVVQQEETTQPLTAQQSRNKKSTKASISQVNEDVKPVNQEEKKVNQEEKAPEKESKNMVLRSRKPSQEKPSKEKEKNGGENVLPQVVTEIKASDITPKTEESTLKETVTTTPKEVKNTDVPADPPALVAEPTEQSKEKTSLPLKRKPSPELSLTHTGKKKRGPKPKPKPILPDPAVLEEIVSPLVGSRRKRGSAKKASVVTTPTKDSLPNINETDITTDTPVVPPQCPTRTKVLPPRKGRGQKYEAMVQKITSPSLKKHLPIPQTDSNLTDDVTTKVLSQHALKEGETSVLIHGPEMMEGEVKSIDSRQEQYSKEETAQERKKHKISQEASTQEEVRTGSEEEVVNKEEMRQENHKAGTPQDGEADKVWSARDGPVEVKPQGKSKQQASEALSSTANNSSRTKRKRWAMVESTDASVVALEADSLIVTTPRLAKQRAIKNNHEMHLKQRRKKRKGQSLQEETEIVQEIKVEAAEQQQERVEEKVNTTESAAPLPISQDEIKEAPQVASTDHIQKPRRGRKPSTDPAKRKRSKSSTEPVPGQPLKVHKKPGPKPGMKDAIEVIEAVIRAAGCESDAKEEREKEERERGEIEKPDKQEESVVGPVVTVSDKKTEIITVKRIRRRPVYQNPKLSFCPYVRINNSRDFSSWCAIVNKPEDAVIFQRRRKKGILRMRNPFTVAKVVPQAAAMLQGPLVNTHLRDRCLTCSLCGKPANYRDLGDLCGPYYTEDSVPRKVLTTSHNESLRIGSEKTNDDNNNNNNSSNSEESGNSLKDEGECSTKKEGNTEALPQEVSSSSSSSSRHHHWRHRRAERPERVGQEGGPRRLTLRERFRRMKQLQSVSTGASGDQGGSGSMFQRLQVEAEAKEHWAHENCAIWTKGVIMVAGRLFGLKEAANNSTQTNCYKCQIAGASLSCCWRGCSHKYHYVCAKEIGCTFHEDDFSIKCPKHEDL